MSPLRQGELTLDEIVSEVLARLRALETHRHQSPEEMLKQIQDVVVIPEVWWIDLVKDAGLVGDGITDETAALNEAIVMSAELGKPLLVTPGRDFVVEGVALNYAVTFLGVGSGAHGFRHKPGASSPAFISNYSSSPGDRGAEFWSVFFDGTSSSVPFFDIVDGDGQSWDRCVFDNATATYIDINADVGLGLRVANTRMTTGGGAYCMVFGGDTVDTGRLFIGLDTRGTGSFDLGSGGRDIICSGGSIGALNFGAASRGFNMSGTYLGNTVGLTIAGSYHQFVGCFMPGTTVTVGGSKNNYSHNQMTSVSDTGSGNVVQDNITT